jgi:predicted membrane GTPase involved in stress response
LVVKKEVQEVIAGDICALLELKKLVILLLIMKIRSFKTIAIDEPTMRHVVYN